ncbi:hypothetical protein ACELLULO517_07535 [Acidisoma cellulosilytica]|uniref:Uncharacterized protein n=1 Tax=Acidisoma cellulosilyticum TaxID=2802395 RepID=A0A964E3A7_9PROT|nr:hypothetical protein [Acidisoma cellulosilyticum]MCB8880082.1 hypothetical protein [Acidisoma cellulosilyticum]
MTRAQHLRFVALVLGLFAALAAIAVTEDPACDAYVTTIGKFQGAGR